MNQKKENKMKELRIKIDDLKTKMSEKSIVINKVFENFETYYNLTENIINSFDIKYLNYYILNSIKILLNIMKRL